MHFLPDVYVTCEVCSGKRYNDATLRVKCKDKKHRRGARDAASPRRWSCSSTTARCAASCRRWTTSASATSRSASRRRRCRAARRSASSCRASSPSATPAGRSTCSTSRPPACTSRTCASCSSVLAPPGRRRQHRARHRAQPRRHQDRRLRHRPRPRGRRARRRGRSPPARPRRSPRVASSYTGQFLAPLLGTRRAPRHDRGVARPVQTGWLYVAADLHDSRFANKVTM